MTLLLLPIAARAEPCPSGDTPLPQDRAALRALAAQLEALPPGCAHDARTLALRGAVANALGRPEEGLVFLEAALLIAPDFAGAELDFAEAMIALGDVQAGLSIIERLLKRPDVPEHVRQYLTQRRTVGAPESGWQTAGHVTLRAGRDSNLNSAPRSSLLGLTLPDGEAILELAENYRVRAGQARLLEMTVQAMRPLEGGGRLQLLGELRARDAEGGGAADYRQLELLAVMSRPLFVNGDALVVLGTGGLDYGGSDLYRGARVSLGRDWNLGPGACRPRLTLDAERRHYPAGPEADGYFLGIGAAAGCEIGSARMLVSARAGTDYARSDQRSGGDQRRSDWRFLWLQPLWSGRIEVDLTHTRQRDARGYSALLENGAVRRQLRTVLRVEYAHPLDGHWEAAISAEVNRQYSNLQLFRSNGEAVLFALRYRW